MRVMMRSRDTTCGDLEKIANSSEYSGVSLILCKVLRAQNPGRTDRYRIREMNDYMIESYRVCTTGKVPRRVSATTYGVPQDPPIAQPFCHLLSKLTLRS